jgi:hypothetical protein
MRQKIVHKHSYKLFEDLQLSSDDFYTSLEQVVTQYQYPSVTIQRVYLKTEGWFTERRQYLKISRGDFHYYICASPFGRSFFISWWYREEEDWLKKQLLKFALYRVLFTDRVLTFFQQDTLLMFTHAIDGIVSEVVEKVQPEHSKRLPNSVVEQHVP